MIGRTLGHYKITAAIGVGGMGEVYRAIDTKLGREVAIKVLPDLFASDVERLARFTREAQALAALNHPNIAAIYGVEESSGVRALVMELVEGEDLSVPIARGPMPFDEALPIARQIADALEAAHDKGVIHRDLKPANVKVRADGTVKVLDFGLAKAMDPAGASSSDALNSPTLTAQGTKAGMILGTAAYMAPEQARGKSVDKRADIWAFGVVLYEMLTGTRLFDGETVSDVLAAVLTREPDLSALPPATPPAARRLLARCLDRDPRKRLRDIGEAALILADPKQFVESLQPLERAHATSRERVAWVIAALALVAAISLTVRGWSTAPGSAFRMPLHFSLHFDPSEIAPTYASIAQDGLRVAFTGRLPGAMSETIFVRSLHEAAAKPVGGTEGVTCCVIFSPDGRWIAFVADNHALRKVPIEGGAATTIVEGNLRFARLAWADDGKILIAQFDPNQPGVIYEVSESGGRPTPVAGKPEQAAQSVSNVAALPGARLVLLTVLAAGRPAMAVQSYQTGERRVLTQVPGVARSVGRSLIWMENGRLMGAPFDTERLALAGDPVAIPTDGIGGKVPAILEVSPSGALLFVPSSTPGTQGLVFIDRRGAKTRVAAREGIFDPRLSPDGARVAVEGRSGGADLNDVWALDLGRGGLSRLSFGEGEDETAVWSPDGAWIAWASSRVGAGRSLYRRRSDGSGAEERLWDSDGRHFHADCWTPDGKGIVVSVDDPKTGWDVLLVTLGPTPSAKPLLTGPFNETSPRVSPDGHWIVYGSDESGRNEIYAQAFPDLGHRVQISVEGGSEPIWNPRGGEIVYRAAVTRHFMSVSLEARETLELSPPRELVSDAGMARGDADHTEFDMAVDGRLLAIEEAPPNEHVDLHIILGWAQAAGLLR